MDAEMERTVRLGSPTADVADLRQGFLPGQTLIPYKPASLAASRLIQT
jgi:hypothetical protein